MCLFTVSIFLPHYIRSQPLTFSFSVNFSYCNVCFSFYFILIFYLFSSIPTKMNKIWAVSLDWRQLWYFQMALISSWNSAGPKFRRRRFWGAKITKIMSPYVNQYRIKICLAYIKISLLGELRVEIWTFFPFVTLKKSCSSPISPTNWARKLKFGM